MQTWNKLTLIAIGPIGWLFLNDHMVTELNLFHNEESGEVKAFGNFFNDDLGKTEFTQFKVWPIPE